MKAITPVILSGGAGSRLWPLSRQARPKQLLALTGTSSMLQATAERAASGDDVKFTSPLVITNSVHFEAVRDQLLDTGVEPGGVVLEPEGRNTAAAALAAALYARDLHGPDCLLLVMPADHHIRDRAAFRSAVAAGCAAAQEGYIVTLGIEPRGPETGYGYIHAGTPLDEAALSVTAFREKPDRATAESYLAQGDWYWNAGLFLFRADFVIEEMCRLCPEVYEPVRKAFENARRDGVVAMLDHDHFVQTESLPFDVAVMERTRRAAVVPVDCGWDDVGSYSALWQLAEKDSDGIAISGEGPVTTIDCRDLYVRSDGVKLAVIGVHDLVIVATRDAILVADRKQSQKVKEVVEALKKGDYHVLL